MLVKMRPRNPCNNRFPAVRAARIDPRVTIRESRIIKVQREITMHARSVVVAAVLAALPFSGFAQQLPADCSKAAAPKQPLEASVLGAKFTPKSVRLGHGNGITSVFGNRRSWTPRVGRPGWARPRLTSAWD